MRRREFIKVIGCTAAVRPVIAMAQQPALPIVAFVGGGTADSATNYSAAFRKGLSESGYVEGKNVTIEYHWLEGQSGGLPSLMADLVRRRVTVIFTANNVGTLAAKAATSDIPLVFVFGLDPVLMGLVLSINRPGGNATGVSFQVSALEPKRFELMLNLLPQVSLVVCWSIQTIQMPKTMRGICRRQRPHLGRNCSFLRPEAARTLIRRSQRSFSSTEGHYLLPPMFRHSAPSAC
jgi:putative ABC transport system substrate-binding protein